MHETSARGGVLWTPPPNSEISPGGRGGCFRKNPLYNSPQGLHCDCSTLQGRYHKCAFTPTCPNMHACITPQQAESTKREHVNTASDSNAHLDTQPGTWFAYNTGHVQQGLVNKWRFASNTQREIERVAHRTTFRSDGPHTWREAPTPALRGRQKPEHSGSGAQTDRFGAVDLYAPWSSLAWSCRLLTGRHVAYKPVCWTSLPPKSGYLQC